MGKKIIITGATGLIGEKIFRKLVNRGDEVTVFTRNPGNAAEKLPGAAGYVKWDTNNENAWAAELEGKDGVIHLAGENVFGRWTDEKKKKIMDSRVKGTKSLVDAIEKAENKPEVFVCASAVGYYGSSQILEFTEDSPPGNDFLAKVTSVWEDEAIKVEKFGVRRASIRTGIALSPDGGALKMMLPAFKLFAGGYIGKGEQWFPWIHIEDVAELYLYTLDNNSCKGPLNAAAPDQKNMKQFTDTLGSVLNRPSMFSVPEFAIKALLAEGAEAVTGGARIIPEKTLAVGYKFKYPELKPALENLVG